MPNLLTLLLALVLAAAAAAQDFSDIAPLTDRSVGRVFVDAPGGYVTGAGVVISSGGSGSLLYLTNNHVIERGRDIGVVFKTSDTISIYRGSVLAASREADLAVLQLDPKKVTAAPPPPLALDMRTLRKGEPVVAIGFPGAADAVMGEEMNIAAFETTLTGGNVSRVLQGSWNNGPARIEIVQHTAPLSPGNSGGPLLDRCGRVIGLNTAIAKGVSGIYLAASARTIADFLDEAGLSVAAASGACEPEAGAGAPARPAGPPPAVPAGPGNGDIRFWAIVGGIPAALLTVLAVIAIAASGRSGGDRLPSAEGRVALTLTIRTGDTSFSRRIGRDSLRAGVVIGRGRGVPVDIDNPRVSREHLRLSLEGRRLMATDLGSTNGTTVDGKPLAPRQPRQIGEATVLTLGGAVEIRLRAGP
ncbi:trypsin-like peptidase domain-containing protein [Cereibacter sphaeroides]|uniref:trypsin-like peptidase domain-containing protein n=1 Tax=Cereibacter sphaeroides TaxID=1063 RepID=UPI001F3B2B9B|nr:trypsin-like peptidase domain-containing protein [Cereibacter sphaeroides]MCE6960161.1 trypsin-like peptidase domain-containing protein [Cereibacter sphaeroides]MCE6967943.1 trypsin-like peptidase domain-containing protein [Cereibacter sphaeroides]MCE6974772.1 trypsin-like peptidase domain-containing protein [Cereibacter sphaeroides]